MADSVLGVLRKKIRHEMNELADAMSVGSCANMEQYRQMVERLKVLLGLSARLLILKKK